MLKKNKIIVLKELVEQLKKQEKSIQDLVLDELDENEKIRWNQITTIEDDEEYSHEKESFLENKKKKYLRRIKEQYSKNAEKQIEIINELIRTKQQYLPIRRKIGQFMYEKRYKIIMIIIFIILCVAYSILKNYGKDGTKENDVIALAIMVMIGYLMNPLVNLIFKKVEE